MKCGCFGGVYLHVESFPVCMHVVEGFMRVSIGVKCYSWEGGLFVCLAEAPLSSWVLQH